jgi:hypothetical protein
MEAIETTSTPAQPFDKQAVAVLGQLRTALAAAIGAIPGPVTRATDLQRAANIDMNLSWRLLKVARAADPLSAGPHVPGRAYIRTFLKAAASAGVGPEVLEAVESATEGFDRFVKIHSGDRHTFNSMISALLANDDAQQFNLQERRAAFRANCHIWGSQATSRVRCAFLDIGDDPTRITIASLDGFIGLRQLRQNAPLIITSACVTTDSRSPIQVQSRPLDPAGAVQQGIALLPEFCSKPLPQLREVRMAGQYLFGELASTGVGNESAITCFTGWYAKDAAPRYRADDNQRAALLNMVRVPCEAVTICVLVREGLFGQTQPKLAVYSDHRAETPYPNRTYHLEDMLLPDEKVVHVGRGAGALCTPDVPRLADMVQYVFNRLGWDGRQFDAYRCQIAYPIMPSTVEITIDLPEGPTS